MSKCAVCKTRPAVWAAQYMDGDEPTFTLLGWHYRGFTVYKVCDPCKEKWQQLNASQPQTIAQQEHA